MITIELTPYEEERLALDKAAKKLGVKKEEVKIYKKSIDARHKNNIKIVYSIGVKKEEVVCYERIDTDKKAVVVGAGPAGLFCALYLCRHGIKPIIRSEEGRVGKEC